MCKVWLKAYCGLVFSVCSCWPCCLYVPCLSKLNRVGVVKVLESCCRNRIRWRWYLGTTLTCLETNEHAHIHCRSYPIWFLNLPRRKCPVIVLPGILNRSLLNLFQKSVCQQQVLTFVFTSALWFLFFKVAVHKLKWPLFFTLPSLHFFCNPPWSWFSLCKTLYLLPFPLTDLSTNFC